MGRTYVLREREIKRGWYLIDAKDKILGRLASQIAKILRGKHKPIFTPYLDCGDYVVVINARYIKITGNKAKQKVYRRYSGYPGGLKEITLERLFEKNPCKVLRLAVERMLSRGSLGKRMLRKLKIYSEASCPFNLKKLTPLQI